MYGPEFTSVPPPGAHPVAIKFTIENRGSGEAVSATLSTAADTLAPGQKPALLIRDWVPVAGTFAFRSTDFEVPIDALGLSVPDNWQGTDPPFWADVKWDMVWFNRWRTWRYEQRSHDRLRRYRVVGADEEAGTCNPEQARSQAKSVGRSEKPADDAA